MTTEAQLISELKHNAKVSGGKPLEQRLADLTLWFHMNKGRIARDNLAARQAFLEKAFWVQMEINALLLERLRQETGSSMLWVPRGMMHENGKEFS